MPRGVRDDERQLCIHDGGLWRHAACPEHGDFALLRVHIHRVTPVRVLQCCHRAEAETPGVAEVYRVAVCACAQVRDA